MGVQEDNLVVHRGKTTLVLFYQPWFEAAGSIAWGVQLKLAFLGLQGLAGVAIAVVVRFGLLVPGKAQMIMPTAPDARRRISDDSRRAEPRL